MRGILKRFLRDLNTPTKKLVFVFMTLIIGFAGPFGTYFSMSILERLMYWGFIIGLSILMITLIRSILLETRPQWSYWKTATVASLIFAITYSALIYSISITLFWAKPGLMPAFVVLVGIVFLIAIAIHAIRFFMLELVLQEQAGSNEPRIMKRLPEEKRGRVIRLSARDHFVDVFTENGMHTIRMRFADAVNETEDAVPGFCVHRSHWVARDAIVDARKKSGRITIFLCDGTVIPASRKYQHNIVDNGFLKDP